MRIKISIKVLITLVVMTMGLMLVAQPQVAMAKKFNLTFQATWPSGLTLYENFTWFAKRVKEMSDGQLNIKTLPAGAIVPPFEVLDATSKGVIDGAHGWGAVLGRKR